MIRYFTRKSKYSGNWYILKMPEGKRNYDKDKLLKTGFPDIQAAFKYLSGYIFRRKQHDRCNN